MSHARSDEISQSLPVPENTVGWLVGKRGSFVNQLSRKSGAQISISDSTSREFGVVWKYVQISGTGRAVDRAKKLIHLRLSRIEIRGANGSIAGSNGGDAHSAGSGSSRDVSLTQDGRAEQTACISEPTVDKLH